MSEWGLVGYVGLVIALLSMVGVFFLCIGGETGTTSIAKTESHRGQPEQASTGAKRAA